MAHRRGGGGGGIHGFPKSLGTAAGLGAFVVLTLIVWNLLKRQFPTIANLPGASG